MNLAESGGAFDASLPPLGGWRLWAFRLAWAALTIAALAALAWSALRQDSELAVTIVRAVKTAVVVAVTTILLRRRQRDPVAALLSLALLVWAISSSVDFAASDRLPQLLDRLRFLLFVVAILLFPDGEWRPPWARKVAILSAAVFALGIAEALGLLPTRAFLPLAIACVLASILALSAQYRRAAGEAQRQQLKWVALGMAVGVGLILAARAGSALATRAPAMARMPILWESMFQLGIVIIACGFLVSLLRYRLYDAESAISRSATYAILTLSTVAVFGGTEALIENLSQNYLGMNVGSISGAMAAAVAAVFLTPLNRKIGNWAERRFRPELFGLKDRLSEKAFNDASADSRSLGMFALDLIASAARSIRSAIAVDGKIVAVRGAGRHPATRWLENHVSLDGPSAQHFRPDDMFRVCLLSRTPRGGSTLTVLLGRRPDGSAYGREELCAITAVLPPLRNHLSSMMAQEATVARQASINRKLRSQLATIQKRLAAIETGIRHADQDRVAVAPLKGIIAPLP